MFDVLWYNIHDTPSPQNFFEDSFLVTLKTLMQEDKNLPCILYHNNGRINFLENLVHDKKTVYILNKVGLHIFLHEPLCIYLNNKVRKSFTEEFSNDYDENEIRADELESIRLYAIKNKLTNITVHTGDYNVEKVFKNYSEHMNLICDDIFLKHYILFQPAVSDNKFTKKFLCLNWRYTHHRQLTAAYLCNLDSTITWFFKQKFDDLRHDLWFDTRKWNNDLIFKMAKKMNWLNAKSPLCLDVTYSAADPKNSFYPSNNNPVVNNTNNKLLDFAYNNCFCIVVNESRFAQPTGNYSEKILEAVRHKRPFIVVAPPHTLEYFKSHGYKTFDLFWDESYDSIKNHEDRIVKIFEIIDNLNSKSLTDLRIIYQEMQEILDHNYNVLISRSLLKSAQQV